MPACSTSSRPRSSSSALEPGAKAIFWPSRDASAAASRAAVLRTIIAGSIFVFVAAVIHLFIFFLESIAWSEPTAPGSASGSRPRPRPDIVSRWRSTRASTTCSSPSALGLGLVLLEGRAHAGRPRARDLQLREHGRAPRLVLITSSPKLWRSALIQGAAPLVGIVLLGIALAIG